MGNQEELRLSLTASDQLTPIVKNLLATMDQLNVKTGGTDKVLKRLETGFTNAASKAGLLNSAVKSGAADYATSTRAAEVYAAALAKVANVKITPSGKAQNATTGQFISAPALAAANAQMNQNISSMNKLAAGTTGLNTVTRSLGSTMAMTTTTGNALAASAVKTQSAFHVLTGNISPSTRYALYDASNSMAVTGAALVALGVAAVATSISWERSFANVARTVGGDAGDLKKQFVDLAQTLPVAFAELTDIGALGGQLGISAAGIESFTGVVAKLTATTNLSSEAAGTALGRFKALLGVSEGQFNNLASSILKVGVNSVATETQIVGIATQISSMGSFAGMTAPQVVGLAGALASIGAPPELSRGVITRVFSTMSEAVAEGGFALDEFARVSGVSAAEFTAAWGTDKFSDVFLKFMEGIKVSGGDAVAVLHGLGITSVRDVPLLMRLASAADEAGVSGALLAQTMRDATDGWTSNSELALQYSKIAETTSARISVLNNNFQAFLATLGDGANGPIKAAVNGLIDLLGTLTDIAANPAASWAIVLAVGLVTLTGVVALATAGFARGAAGALGMKQAMEGLGFAAATTSRAMGLLKWSLIATGVGAAVLAIGSLVATLASSGGAFKSSSEKAQDYFGDLSGLQQAMIDDTKGSGEAIAYFTGHTEKMTSKEKAAAAQAANLAQVMGELGSASDGAGKKAVTASLKFGQTAQNYIKSQLALSTEFQNAVKDDNFVKYWDTVGADVDTAIKIAATKGQKGVQEYFYGLEQAAAKSKKGVQSFNTGEFFVDGEKMDSAFSGGGNVVKFTEALGGLSGQAQTAANSMKILGGGATQSAEDMELAAAKSEALQTAYADASTGFINTGDLIKKNQETQKAAAEATADAWTKWAEEAEVSTDNVLGTWEHYYDGSKLNLDAYLADLDAQVKAQENWENNMITLAQKGVSQEVIDDLTRMGAEGVPLVQALVDGTDEQLDRYKVLWKESGRENALQYAAGLLEVQTVLETAAASIGKNSGAATVQKFLNEVQAGRTPFSELLSKYKLDAQGNPIPLTADDADARRQVAAYAAWVGRQSATFKIQTRIEGGLPVAAGAGYVRSDGVSKATGGYIRGAGTGTSDSIPARLSNGEFVMTAAATRRIGSDELYRMMRGQKSARGFATGGLVGSSGGSGGSGSFSTLDASALQAILALADRPIILYTDDRTIAESASRGSAELASRGTR